MSKMKGLVWQPQGEKSILHLVLWQWLLSTPWTNARKAVEGWSSFLWDCACSVESISFMDPRQTGYSSVSCHSLSSVTWTIPLLCILISNAVSELTVVFCNDIHVNNLENKLFTLKVGYLIVSKSLYYTFYCMCASTWCLTHHTWGFYHLKTFILKSYYMESWRK